MTPPLPPPADLARLRAVELSGAVALVTGGGQGLGLAMSRRLTAAGCRVVVADLPDSPGAQVAEELGGTFVPVDVTVPEDSARAVAVAEQTYGGLDVAVLNAGVSTGCSLGADFDLALYRRANGVNLDGVVFGVHAAAPAIARRGGGAIVATASLAGLVQAVFDPVYAANKSAVVGLVRSLVPWLAADGIAVHALCPGFAETAIIEDIRELLAGTTIIDPSDVAEALVRALASGSTGEAWVIQPGRIEPYRFRGVPGPRT